MCFAIVELKYRVDTADQQPFLVPCADEQALYECVEAAKINDQVIRIRVYRHDSRWDRVEHWVHESENENL